MIPSLTFLSEWEAFYFEFQHSTTYALAHSSAASTMPSLIIDDDDDNRTMIEADDPRPAPLMTPSDSSALLSGSWKKLINNLLNFLDSLDGQAPCKPILHSDTRQHSPPCPAPHLACTLQQVLRTVPPPAPNPQACPIMASQFAPPLDQCPHIMPPDQAAIIQKQPLPPPEPQTVMMDHDQLTGFSHKPPRPPKAIPKIPPWARPAAIAGDNHWPPPRPELKTTPYKKKAMTKCTVAPCIQEKDSLHPP